MIDSFHQIIDWRIDNWDDSSGTIEPLRSPQYKPDHLMVSFTKPDKASSDDRLIFEFKVTNKQYEGFNLSVTTTFYSQHVENQTLTRSFKVNIAKIPFIYYYPTIKLNVIKKLHVNINCKIHKPKTKTLAKRNLSFSGLINSGNTCYMNCILQLLYHTPIFRKLIYSIEIDNYDSPKNRFVYSLQRLFYTMKTDKVCSTKEFVDSLGLEKIGAQRDAIEFLWLLLQTLQQNFMGTSIGQRITDIFGLEYEMIEIENGIEKRKQIETTLQLPISVSDGACSVADLINRFFSCEKINIDNKNIKIERKIRAKKLPPILLVALDRMEFDCQKKLLTKCSSTPHVPKRLLLKTLLDEEPARETESGESDFRLFGVVFHRGAAAVGHYFSIVRAQPDGPWIRFDDADATPINRTPPRSMSAACEAPGAETVALLAYYREEEESNVFKPEDEESIPAPVKHGAVPGRIVRLRALSYEMFQKGIENGLTPFYSEISEELDFELPLSHSIIYQKLTARYKYKKARIWKLAQDGSIRGVMRNDGQLSSEDESSILFVEPITEKENLAMNEREAIRVFVCVFTPGGDGRLVCLYPAYVSPRQRPSILKSAAEKRFGSSLSGPVYIDRTRGKVPTEVKTDFGSSEARNCSLVIFTAMDSRGTPNKVAPRPIRFVKGLPIKNDPSIEVIDSVPRYYDSRFFSVDVLVFVFSDPSKPISAVRVCLSTPKAQFFKFLAKSASFIELANDEKLVLFGCQIIGMPQPRPINTTNFRTAGEILKIDEGFRPAIFISKCHSSQNIHRILSISQNLRCLHFERNPKISEIIELAGLTHNFEIWLCADCRLIKVLTDDDIWDDARFLVALDSTKKKIKCSRALLRGGGAAVQLFGPPFFLNGTYDEIKEIAKSQGSKTVICVGETVVEDGSCPEEAVVAFLMGGDDLIFPQREVKRRKSLNFSLH